MSEEWQRATFAVISHFVLGRFADEALGDKVDKMRWALETSARLAHDRKLKVFATLVVAVVELSIVFA